VPRRCGCASRRPRVTDDPAEIGPVDVVFLGLKAYSYAASGALLSPLMHDSTAVVAAQNGIPWWYFHGVGGALADTRLETIDPAGAVSAVIPPERAVGCVVYCSTTIERPGVIRHEEGTRFSIGEPDGSLSPRCSRFSAAMVAGGLKCPIEADIRSDIWLKLMGNISFNPLSALTGATMVRIARHRQARELVTAMMEETLAIATAVGAEPAVSIERRLEGAERVGEHKTSMLTDLEAGKPLELDVIMAAPIEIAGLVGVDVPALSAVHAAVRLLADEREGTR
jgi:2-dehydropantoate 2-reductase